MKILSYVSIILFVFLINKTNSQTNEKWVSVYNRNGRSIAVDVFNLNVFTGRDIYVWVMQTNNIPLIIESVPGKIYKTKTYYLINKKLKKYSILQIIYYDKHNNVLRSFSYKVDTKNDAYRYNYPILPGSDMNLVLNTCLKYINKPNLINKK